MNYLDELKERLDDVCFHGTPDSNYKMANSSIVRRSSMIMSELSNILSHCAKERNATWDIFTLHDWNKDHLSGSERIIDVLETEISGDNRSNMLKFVVTWKRNGYTDILHIGENI